jgi:O-antigen ligase
MRILLPVVAALVPAAILPGFSFYFDITPKIVILLAGVALSLLLWDASWPASRARYTRWMLLLFALQLLWLAIASAMSTHPALSVYGSNWRRFGLLSYAAVLTYSVLVMLDCSGRPDRVIRYLRAIVLTSIPVSVYGIAQYFGFDPWLAAAGYHAGEGPFTIVRPPSTLGHANYFATYLLYIVFAAYALTVAGESRLLKSLAVIAGLLATAGIVFSGTRAAMVGTAIGIAVLAVRRPALHFNRLLQVGGVSVAAMIVLFISPAGDGLRSRIHWSLEEPLGGARPLLWRDTIRMAAYRLANGYGPETFVTEFPKHQSVNLSRAYPDFQHESPHNVFLDALVAQGIPGLLLFVAVVALALYLAFFGSRDAAILPVLGAGLAGGLASQQFNVFTAPTALYLFLMVALITASDAHAPLAEVKRVWPRGVAGLMAIVFIIYAGQLAFADHQLALSRNALARNDIQQALAHYRNAETWHPSGSSADLYLSRELANRFRLASDVRVKLQTWTPAFQAAVRAATTSEEKPNAFYNLAIFFATQNDAANVERSLRNAIVWAPNWFKPHWTLAKLYSAQKRLPEAEKEAQLAADLNGGKDQEVMQTLQGIRSAIAGAYD